MQKESFGWALRVGAQLLICLLPQAVKRAALGTLFGWKIDPSATIGLSLLTDIEHVELKSGARIGHFNVIRNLRRLDLGMDAVIGQWNWVTAAPVFYATDDVGARGCLTVGRHSHVTSRHYIDCSGGLVIGEFTTVAGVRSTIYSHQIDTNASRQTIVPVTIGDYCYVGSDVRVTPGSR